VTDDDADGSSSSESSDYWEEVPCAADDEVAYIKDRLENPLPEENDKLKSTEEPLSSTFKGTLKIRVPGVGQPGKSKTRTIRFRIEYPNISELLVIGINYSYSCMNSREKERGGHD